MICIHNCNINVIVEGQGSPIVLLHGWGQNLYMMKFLQDYLSEHHQVINLDLPGFGKSEEPPEAWSMDAYASCIHDLLASLNIEKPTIIAHSFGARIAFHYALKYPITKMIITGGAGIAAKHGITYYIRIYTYKLMKKLHHPIAMGSVDYQQASVIMRGVLVKSVNEDIRDRLNKITVETLLVWGEHDMQTPLWMGKVMEKEMQNATLIILKRDDHFAYFHQSLRFTRIVEAFLGDPS